MPPVVRVMMICFATLSVYAQMPTDSPISAIRIQTIEAAEHFMSGTRIIHSADQSSTNLDAYVFLQIVVAPDGSVVTASPIEGRSEWYNEAVLLAKDWHYAPFTRNRKSVYVSFSEAISVVPPEKRPIKATPFPPISDWNSLKIELRRTGCFGTCPSYKLVVLGNGNVQYEGGSYARYCGKDRGNVRPEVVQRLVDMFRDADFFNLFDSYSLNATDLPTYYVSIMFDSNSKTVRDYWGLRAGMPESVDQIENAIDRLAGPQVWANPAFSNVCGIVPLQTLPSKTPSDVQ